MHHHKRGFTLVELLIAIVVIAILAAISIVSYNGIQNRARDTSVMQTASSINKQVQLRNAIEGSYLCTTCSTTSQQAQAYEIANLVPTSTEIYFYNTIRGNMPEFDKTKVIVIYNEVQNSNNNRWLSVSRWSIADQVWHGTFYEDGEPVRSVSDTEPFTSWASSVQI